ncbi:MAG: Holliday junction resolvase RuvX [Oscillospiraceae bacterium]
MRIMAVDYGDARTGLAVSDAGGFLAGEAWVVSDWNAERLADTISTEARARGVERLVMGYPRNMDGTLGPRAEKYSEFAKLVSEKSGIEVVLWDERRTTVDAHRILSEAGKRGKKRRETVDAVAATLILEGYLESLK